jgi:hypothetical protein
MSTRCQIAFTRNSADHRQKEALVYRHHDGGLSGAGADLNRFFEEVRAANDNHDTRFDDPEYLAARYITWQALRYAVSCRCSPLATTGVGITQDYHIDIEYLYVVVCRDPDAIPQVYVHREFDGESGDPADEPALVASLQPAKNRFAMRI